MYSTAYKHMVFVDYLIIQGEGRFTITLPPLCKTCLRFGVGLNFGPRSCSRSVYLSQHGTVPAHLRPLNSRVIQFVEQTLPWQRGHRERVPDHGSGVLPLGLVASSCGA